MGHFYRRDGTKVRVYLTGINGKTDTRPLSRDLTKHLDGQSDHNILYWIEQEELKRGVTHLPSTQDLDEYRKRFVDYYKDTLKKSGNTWKEHDRHLKAHVIPYFLQLDPPLKDLNFWPQASVKMMAKLKEDGLTDGQVYRCNIALRKFYLFLAEERVILGDGKLLLRTPAGMKAFKETPLKVFLNPEDILTLAVKQTDKNKKLALLLGYFCSLRSQEVFGLKVGDLRASKLVTGLESSKAMASLGLFSGMAVNVTRQMDKRGEVSRPKSGSTGWVNCFNREAAKLIIEGLKGRQADEYIITVCSDAFYKAWGFEFALKDLRRSSAYWLGHNTEMGAVKLGKHMRHKNLSTLQLYLRRPEESLGDYQELELVD
jgi:site-specific recombinase XerD